MPERIHGPTTSDTSSGVTLGSEGDAMRKLIKKKLQAFNPYRRSKLLEIKVNISYLCNHQNIKVVGGQIVPLGEPYATLVIANKIFPAVKNDIAVSTKASPKFDVVPSGTDEDDKATAKAGEKILPYLQRVNDPHLHRRSVILWYDVAGCGWRKVFWNPNHKVVGRNPLPDEEGHNPQIEPVAPIFQGEVIVEHVPNTELIFDWRQKNLHNLKWIIQHKTVTLSWVRANLGEKVANAVPGSALHDKADDEESFEAQIMSDFSDLSQALTTDPEASGLVDNDKLVNYYEFWHIPDKNMPQGAFAVGLGDIDKADNFILAVNQPYPKDNYPHQELPYIPADPLALDGIVTGSVPPITYARPLQREYNKVRSLILDNIDGMGNSVVFVPKGANVDRKKVTNVSGNFIEWDGNFTPKREPGVPIPSAFFAHLEVVRRDIDEIFAFHEPSKGIMPEGGPRSAIGLQTLQEADITQLSPMIRALDESDERVAHQMLSLAIANYRERLIQIIGKDNQWTLEKISPEELNGKINVIVRSGSSLPLNKTLEQEKMVGAWQSGLLGNPTDPNVRQRVLKAMDLGGIDQILQDSAKQVNFAQKEFLMAEKLAMQMPQPPTGGEAPRELIEQFVFVPPPNEFDDDYIHAQEHSNTLLDKYFEYIGSGQVHLQILAQAMRMHLNLHNQRIQQMQLQMMMMENPQAFKEKDEGKKT